MACDAGLQGSEPIDFADEAILAFSLTLIPLCPGTQSDTTSDCEDSCCRLSLHSSKEEVKL